MPGPDHAAALAPTGPLRAGVMVAPMADVVFAHRPSPEAPPEGVTVDLFASLAQAIGRPLQLEVFGNSGACTEALAAAAIDVAAMPVDAERRARLAFGPGYYRLRSLFLCTGPADTLAAMNAPGRRFLAIAGTTTLRAACRAVPQATALQAASVAEALDRLEAGEAEALALSEIYLRAVQPRFPGSRLMAEAFQETTVAIAVPPGRPEALAAASAHLRSLATDGRLRAMFDRHGLHDAPVTLTEPD